MKPLTMVCLTAGDEFSTVYAVLRLDLELWHLLQSYRAAFATTQAALRAQGGAAAEMLYDVELFDYTVTWSTELPLPQECADILLDEGAGPWWAVPRWELPRWPVKESAATLPTDSETLHITAGGVFWSACRDGTHSEWETAELSWDTLAQLKAGKRTALRRMAVPL